MNNDYNYNLKVADQIEALLKPIKENFQVKNLWISKFYRDGYYIDLTENLDLKQELINEGYYEDLSVSFGKIDAFAYARSIQRFWIADDADPLTAPCARHNLHSGLTFFSFKEDFVEIFSLLSDLDLMHFYSYAQQRRSEFLGLYFHLHNETRDILSPSFDDFGKVDRKPKASHRKPLSLPEECQFEYIEVEEGRLSLKQAVIVALFARGLSYKTIARKLDISPRTVETHILRIRERLNLQDRNDFFRIYYQTPFFTDIDPDFLLSMVKDESLEIPSIGEDED